MLCRDRTSRVELASAQSRSWSEGKRPTRSFTVIKKCCEQAASTWQSVQTWCTAGARVDCRAESQLLSRREPALVSRREVDQHREARRYVALACCGSRSTLSSRREQSALPLSLGAASAVRLPHRQRRRNERRDLRAGLHRTFESTYPAAPDRLAALRKPAVSHGTPLPWAPFSPPL